MSHVEQSMPHVAGNDDTLEVQVTKLTSNGKARMPRRMCKHAYDPFVSLRSP